MDVYVNLIVFTTDIPNKKKYLLSIDREKIVFPRFKIDNTNKLDVDSAILQFLRPEYLIASDYEIMPQIAHLHSELLTDNDNQLNAVYASVVPNTTQINYEKCWWKEFSFLDDSNKEESFLLMNVLRNLL